MEQVNVYFVFEENFDNKLMYVVFATDIKEFESKLRTYLKSVTDTEEYEYAQRLGKDIDGYYSIVEYYKDSPERPFLAHSLVVVTEPLDLMRVYDAEEI